MPLATGARAERRPASPTDAPATVQGNAQDASGRPDPYRGPDPSIRTRYRAPREIVTKRERPDPGPTAASRVPYHGGADRQGVRW